jgi:hypothetical protein
MIVPAIYMYLYICGLNDLFWLFLDILFWEFIWLAWIALRRVFWSGQVVGQEIFFDFFLLQ